MLKGKSYSKVRPPTLEHAHIEASRGHVAWMSTASALAPWNVSVSCFT